MGPERPGLSRGDRRGELGGAGAGPLWAGRREPGQPPVAPERPAVGTAPARPYGDGPVPPGALRPREAAPRDRPPAPAEPAGWWRRAAATVVDAVVLAAVTVLILVAVGAGLVSNDEVDPGELLLGLVGAALTLACVALLYAPLLMALTGGRTLGKAVAGCRVVRADGRPVGFWWAALREVAVKGIVLGIATALTAGIALIVDGAWPLWDRHRRALHDLVVDSRVVRG